MTASKVTTSNVPAQAAADSAPDDVRQLEQEIAATRERLGEAVEELAAKLDVKSQAKARANRIKGQLQSRAVQVKNQAVARAGAGAAPRRPGQLAGAGAAGLVVAGLVTLLLRRRKR
jgi:hypothetical protein